MPMRISLIGVVCVIAAGCSTQTRAAVDCAGVGDAISCKVEHVSGPAKVRVCWDFVMACKNEARSTGSGCSVVEPGQRSGVQIPLSDLKRTKPCDAVVASSVENIRLVKVD